MARKGRKNKSYNQFCPKEITVTAVSIIILSSSIYSGAFGIDSENDAKWNIDFHTLQIIEDCIEFYESGDGSSNYHKLCEKLMDTLDVWKGER